jgi:two-component system phosphate regulon sensor histidine kinase PhoR
VQRGLRTEIQRISLTVLVLTGIGLINGHLSLTLLCGFALYLAWTLRQILKLYRWLETRPDELPPESYGVWADICDQLYRLQQSNKRATQLHRNVVNRVKSITTALEEGLVLLNSNRELDWWNPAAKQIFNLQKNDRGQAITNLIRSPAFVKFIYGGKFKKSLEISAPNDDQRKLLISASKFEGDNTALVVQDITRLRNMEQMRTDFVANISHELRTPLTVISGYIETLQANNGSLPPAWNAALEQMSQQTQRMNALANDLVMLSQLESMDTPPSRQPVKLQPLLEQIVQDASALASDNHNLILECEPELTISGESKELYSAFSNLVINAIKHNPEGADIRITAERQSAATVVHVSDNGIGIDPKHIGRLTERFYRTDQSRASQTGGTGLGLAIVKHILLRHHATLSISSRRFSGSTFSCRFAD